ncbi:hypothetical protein FA10DRAFT_139136 [Acaromyces ingoldii]|uniref:Uncharacterized protein n=1 Tax=Acaromyces ingoldii TaxID=215250 RepID=A0A316YIJ1_9BASI|nr:hypothetical protein FA10DRAFT_139136 [Acaromyces ingoldii]PWN89247.1 hypothetical protein FA10DRAFT_139136 [Acaromyces ingoldii]
MYGNTLTLVLAAVGMARAMPMPQATPAPSVKPAGPPGIRPEFAITDGKISAGLSIGYVGLMNGPGNSESGLLSLGGDLNTANLIEGGIEEADTESIEGPLFTLVDGGIGNGPVDVSGTINPTGVAVSGLVGAVTGAFLGQPYTVIGGFHTIGGSLGPAGPEGTAVPYGEADYGSIAGASGSIDGGAGATHIGGYASGAGHLGQATARGSASLALLPTPTAGVAGVGELPFANFTAISINLPPRSIA